MSESRMSEALCGVMEQALIEKGIDPVTAKMLAERACTPAVDTVVRVTKKTGRKISKYQREWGRQLKKIKKTSRLKNGSYRKGWDRTKEFAKAHKMTRKAMK